MGTRYETDVIAWANEQAALLRAGQLDQLDIEHLADEIEDVGKSEKRELASRMAVLIAHLLKWQFQPERRGSGWERAIHEQRKSIVRQVEKSPSLKHYLADGECIQEAWSDAVIIAISETNLDIFSDDCPWDSALILTPDFYPTAS